MTPSQLILASIALARSLNEMIPQWVEAARGKGELSPDAEAAFQAHKREVYSAPYAQPSSEPSSPGFYQGIAPGNR